MTFTAACLQLNSSSDIAANCRVIEPLIRDTAKSGAKLICLPENAYWMRDSSAPMGALPTMENHPGIAQCMTLAKSLSVWILIGSIAVESPVTHKAYNRSLLINDQGEVAASYDKIHLFDVTLKTGEAHAESACFLPGDKAVLAQTPWGKIGMTVCYDLRFPMLYRQLAKAGADFLVVPSAFTETTGKAHWHVLLRARAIENGCYVLAPAQHGSHGKRRTYGAALIVNPWGEIIAEKPEGVGFITAEIDLNKVTEARSSIPSLQHDRDFSI